MEQMFKDQVRPAPGRACAGDATRSQPAAASDHATETSSTDRHVVDDRFKSMADLLIKKRLKEKRWTTKSKNQAEQIFTLMTRFMKEERSIENISNVRQKDMAAFNSFLESEIYKHHGKSEKDKHRSIAELRIIALSKPEDLRGLETGTLNRHLGFIDQLTEFSEAEGVELDSKLKVAKLRSVDTSDERDRDERLKLPLAKIENLFKQPPFVNCAGWDRLSKEGADGQSLVYHGALYFIPMMIFYGGGRREEYCG
jgi:hypothetical protein